MSIAQGSDLRLESYLCDVSDTNVYTDGLPEDLVLRFTVIYDSLLVLSPHEETALV